MKIIFTSILILTFSFCFSQSLPIDFESGVTTSNFADFDGGYATVITNPQSSGSNTSATVARIIRSGGQVWAGSKLALTNNLNFSTNSVISMKVFTSAPVGTTVKFKLEGSGSPIERDAVSTVSGAWETLTWDFTGTPSGLNELIFMFDFGNLGDSLATSTFLFDDIEQIAGGTTLTLPIDFESGIATADFIDFDGGTGSITANPQSGGTNTSAIVGQIVRNGGQVWAGSKLLLATNLDFTTQSTISMQVFTTAPVGTIVKFKLEGISAPVEKDATTTVTGDWETLTWDFTGAPSDLHYLVLMFDFGVLGDGSATSTFLFDDIVQGSGGTSGGTQIDLPVSFESSNVNYAVTDFGDNSSTLVVDPQLATNHVIKTVKLNTAAAWAGTTIGTAAGFKSNIPFTLTDSKMYVNVWSPDAGIPIRLKVENSNDNTQTCETEAITTLAGTWEVLEFNFANEAAGTAALSFGLTNGWTYNMASIFFNFGTDGATAGEKVYYFDNVSFTNPSTNVLVTNISVTGMGGATNISAIGGTLQMQASIMPTNATNQKVSWNTNPSSGLASINSTGLLSASGNGNVWVIATAKDLSNVKDSVQVVVTNQTTSIYDLGNQKLEIYPNPTSVQWTFISNGSSVSLIELFDLQGKRILTAIPVSNSTTIDAGSLKNGIYLTKVYTESGIEFHKLVKY